MLDLKREVEDRVNWIRSVLADASADGVVFGSSGGKDSALVAILCRMATPKVTGVIMPCESSRNYGIDRDDALSLHEKFDIETIEVDITPVKKLYTEILKNAVEEQNSLAYMNINPRLRMITLYNIAQRRNYLVAGTGNRSETVMGYFTKWGDGASDFNPISDLTVREVYTLLEYLEAPSSFLTKAPSAALTDDQTDEKEMGLTYAELDDYILFDRATPEVRERINRQYERTAHKRHGIRHYSRKI